MNLSLKIIWGVIVLFLLLSFTYLALRDIPVPQVEIRKNIKTEPFFQKTS